MRGMHYGAANRPYQQHPPHSTLPHPHPTPPTPISFIHMGMAVAARQRKMGVAMRVQSSAPTCIAICCKRTRQG